MAVRGRALPSPLQLSWVSEWQTIPGSTRLTAVLQPDVECSKQISYYKGASFLHFETRQLCGCKDGNASLSETKILKQLCVFDAVPLNCVQAFMVRRKQTLRPDFSCSNTMRLAFTVLTEVSSQPCDLVDEPQQLQGSTDFSCSVLTYLVNYQTVARGVGTIFCVDIGGNTQMCLYVLINISFLHVSVIPPYGKYLPFLQLNVANCCHNL